MYLCRTRLPPFRRDAPRHAHCGARWGEEGVTKSTSACAAEIGPIPSRVNSLSFHPTVASLCAATCQDDGRLLVCDIEAATPVCDVRASDDLLYKAAWDPTGARLAVTSRDRILRLFDPRAPATTARALAHEGKAPIRALFVDAFTLLTVGASLSSERQIRSGRLLYVACMPQHSTLPITDVALSSERHIQHIKRTLAHGRDAIAPLVRLATGCGTHGDSRRRCTRSRSTSLAAC